MPGASGPSALSHRLSHVHSTTLEILFSGMKFNFIQAFMFVPTHVMKPYNLIFCLIAD